MAIDGDVRARRVGARRVDLRDLAPVAKASNRRAAVTLRQLFPPSWLRWTRPLSVPSQITRSVSGESAIEKITP
jgi:hypothetical protein